MCWLLPTARVFGSRPAIRRDSSEKRDFSA
jgi:hypothetical protein